MGSKSVLSEREMSFLYHTLRRLSMVEDKEPVFKLSKHLLCGPSYLDLVEFLQWWGTTYYLKTIVAEVKRTRWTVKRVWELGSGTGWLGLGLASALNVPFFTADKRPEFHPTIVLSLEDRDEVVRLKEALGEGDLIVLSHCLHCLDNPKSLVSSLKDYPLVILEPNIEFPDLGVSWRRQLKAFGAKPLSPKRLFSLIHPRPFRLVTLGDQILLLVKET